MNRLTRLRLETFLRCQRRFQLRYEVELPWPSSPEGIDQVARQQQGELFHQLVAQYFLRTPVELVDEAVLPADVQRWWRAFLTHPPAARERELALVETTLTVPLGEWQLIGRFDLLLKNGPQVDIFDWKTGSPRTRAELERDWQTRLYMALLWRGHEAVGIDRVAADHLKMTYWYTQSPETPVTLAFDATWHERNVAEIEEIVAAIASRLTSEGIWPLTEDLRECAFCAYRNYCGRHAAADLIDRKLGDGNDFAVYETEWEEAAWENTDSLIDEGAIE